MKFLLIGLLISTASLAHYDSDWGHDVDAYLAVEYASPFQNKKFTTEAPKRIDMNFFKEKLIVFASINRKTKKDLDTSRAFLVSEYKALGFATELHPFGSGTNFIAEKKGTLNPEKILILSSHIDTVGNKGANDNGTGTIGVMAVAKELAKSNYPYTIRVLGFDREENGLKGSDAYVAALPDKKNIIGDINFEMMGFHQKNDGGFHVIDCAKPFFRNVTKQNSVFLSDGIKKSIETLGLDLTVVKTCTNRSDHASFWRHNIPAIVISENFFGGDADPCYHASCDVVDDRLNYEYMGKILEATLMTTENFLSL
jgi:hypothetical protein